MRKQREVLADWANDLSTRLGRSAEEIRGKGLSAYDFSPSQRVRLNFGDGSFAEFRYAFACIRRESAQVAIFTEHCGYLEFSLAPEMEVIETQDTFYRHE